MSARPVGFHGARPSPMRHLPRLLAPTVLAAAAALLPACDSSGAAEPADGPAHGIVVLSADPAHSAFTPEELATLPTRLYYHDFGRVPLGEVVQHAFPIRNTDPRPVAITRMQSKCGCTTAEVRYEDADGDLVRSLPKGNPRIVLPAGQDAVLNVRVDTSLLQRHQHNADQLATIQVATDSPNNRFFQLEAHYLPVVAFQATPMPIDVGRISRNAGGFGRTDLVRTGAVPTASVVGIGETPPDVRATIHEEDVFGSPLWVVEVELIPPLEPGPLSRTFDILTDDGDGTEAAPVRAHVLGHVVEDVDWSPLRLVARPPAPGAAPEAEVEVFSHVPGMRFALSDPRLEGEGADELEVAVLPIARDPAGRSAGWRVRLKAPGAPFAPRSGTLRLALDDPARPEIAIDYTIYGE